ncbi:hypothetical protein FKM82_001099 [Ascaphus truei]
MKFAFYFPMTLLHSFCTIYTVCVLSVLAKKQCTVTQGRADCSHQQLSEIPSDLPRNITVLDLSHNQLKQLPSANLSKYDQLVQLDVGFNILHQFDPALCENLPLLKILNLQHNEYNKISEKYFISCTNLIELHLNSNGISSISGNPFEKLANLCVLDMSRNKMTSTALGTKQQLPNLQALLLFSNKISELKREALEFLGNTSLQKLDLSSNSVKVIHPGCFRPLRNLHTLTIENTQLGPNLTQQLCSELVGTGIQVLLLSNVQLSKVHNTTFTGLAATNLTTLDISKNSLSQIDSNSFVFLKDVEVLNLEDNDISHVSSGTFSGLSKVKSLNLKNYFSHSKASKLDDLSFQWLKNLEFLNMDNNKISNLTENTFTGLTSLKVLSLSQCTVNLQTITNKTFSSLANSPLLSLNLTKTGIANLEKGAFSCLGHLQTLDLGLNRINQELNGQEFLGLQHIEMIYLSYNNHLTLSSNSFISVPSLKKLFLRKTGLSIMYPNPSPFKVLQNLTILDLSNNNIANIQDNVFEGLSNLRILNFQHNNLARLWKHFNPGGPVLFLKGLCSLEILSLVSNGFDEIPAAAFKGLSQLQKLELGENNVNILPPSLFDDQRSLLILDI